MRDYNFFSDYVYVKNTIKIKKFILPIFCILLFAGVGAAWFLLDQRESELQETYDANQKVLESEAYSNTMAETQALKEELAYLQGLNEEVYIFELLMNASYKVTDELMGAILEATPQNVSFTDYSINEQAISISAHTTDYSFVSEFQTNLKEIKEISRVLVTNITSMDEDDRSFSFEVQIEFGGEFLE